MALRSISRAGMDVAGRAAGKGRAGAVTHRPLVGAERMVSSFVGQGHFGRSQALPYRQGSMGSGTQLFKLVETDLMSKELTRYGPSDAEPLGLYAVHDVLADIAAAASALREPAVAVSNAPPTETENASVSSKEELAPAPSTGEEDVLAAWGLGPRVTDTAEVEGLEAPASEEVSEKMAIKRTYQPSTLKRKRKHGFLYRAKTRLGKKIMQRRQEKGRWRLGI